MMDMGMLELLVIGWGVEKGIFEKATPESQMGKMMEEVMELDEAVRQGDKEAIRLELGDVLVTAVLQAEMQGLSLSECLEAAYKKISKRTGKMVDGVFVKDGE